MRNKICGKYVSNVYARPLRLNAGGALEIAEGTKAWFEGENYYWHTYEGKYMDMDYQLVIGYLGEYHQKVISFFPKIKLQYFHNGALILYDENFAHGRSPPLIIMSMGLFFPVRRIVRYPPYTVTKKFFRYCF